MTKSFVALAILCAMFCSASAAEYVPQVPAQTPPALPKADPKPAGPAVPPPGPAVPPAAPVPPQAGPAPVPPAPAPAAPQTWQKIETKALPLPNPRQYLTPGMMDPDLQHLITFPKDGSAVDLGLPHAGKDKAGKDFPALMARYAAGVIWVDLNGDGKPTNGETSPIGLDGFTEPFSCDLHYSDGTTGEYAFRLKQVVEKEKYAIVRCMARQFEFKGQHIVMIDDDSNGKFDDAEHDCLFIGDFPVTTLGKYIPIGDDFFEILVHDAGTIVEIRPAPKMELGTVNVVEAFHWPQKSQDSKLDVMIIRSADSSFSFNDRRPTMKIPTGAYDLVYGLFERNKEMIFLKKGDKTSFTVAAGDKNVVPKYGGKISAQVECDSDGQDIYIHKPTFMGEAGERYFPENFKVVSVWAFLAQVYLDTMKIENFQDIGGKRRYDVTPEGELKDVVIRRLRDVSEEYQASVEFDSGILGKVIGKQRFEFVFRKKDKETKAKPVEKAAKDKSN
jgi:hypothetical protein